ncbi:Branched-chain-amino-acid aminotransferase 5, chloroplastic [Hordeum vulgare]|nr:Branched-chain-amino-acid aminotransferase 5, chloroplastic [Hordeum vulgare]
MELRLASSSGPAAPSLAVAGRRPRSSLSPPLACPLSLQIQNHVYSMPTLHHKAHTTVGCQASVASKYMETPEIVDLDWENLGFGLVNTDFLYMAKCGPDGNFSKGEILPFGPIALSPSAGVLNYGQGLFEGLKAYRKTDGSVLLFRPEENAVRMKNGSDRMCMPAPTVEQFVDAVKQTVLANKRWVPPTGKGSLYIRPLLIGSGAILGLAPAPEYTFLIYVSPVGNYFKEGLAPINLIIEDNFHRAAPGGTGGVKTIGNYASVLKAQRTAKEKGYSDVLYLDAVHNKYLEEVSSCNIFVVKGNIICTPAIEGTILPGITRKSIIEVAESKGYKVEERHVSVDELLDADEVFCTGTAVVVSPVGSITYKGKRVKYDGNQGVGVVSQQLYTSLTSLQMGHADDPMGWTVQLN